MKQFGTFIFEGYEFDRETLQAKFLYSFDGEEKFEEIIDFRCEGFELSQKIQDEFSQNNQENAILDNFLFNLHLALGISYYKLFPTQFLEIQSGYLSDQQIAFWQKFYVNGLGEFFITNNIDPNGLVNFRNAYGEGEHKNTDSVKNYIKQSEGANPGKTLLLWGGGKDSIASYSLLKNKKNIDLFVFGKLDSIKKTTAKISGENLLLVKRTLSEKLFELNKEGYYNGHVPITGMIAFVTFVVSYLYGYSSIVLSNEQSASEENTVWKGLKVNHQYSKSLEFEQDLQSYVENYISRNIKYFSLLRGMYEYKIAEIFSREKEFFDSFSSCNRNFVITKNIQKKLWCCECEKCCFVFLILSPFLEPEELVGFFGENLFENATLEKTFRELIGLENHKPFECVGTYDECLLSAKKAIKKYTNILPPSGGKLDSRLPLVLQNLQQEVLEKCDDIEEEKLENKLLKISQEDIIPEDLKKLL